MTSYSFEAITQVYTAIIRHNESYKVSGHKRTELSLRLTFDNTRYRPNASFCFLQKQGNGSSHNVPF